MAEAPEAFDGPQQQNIIACHNDFVEETEHMYSNCLNSCCTGSFIKETMAGIIMSHEIKEIIFTGKFCMENQASKLQLRLIF